MGWTNNSDNTGSPPDFFNKREKIMLEVMRVDHYTYFDAKDRPHNKNTENIGRIVRSLIDDGKTDILDEFLIVGAVDLDEHEADYSYRRYLDSFRWVLDKHISSIPTYRNDYPGYKLVFLIFDESASYAIADGYQDITSEGTLISKRIGDVNMHIPCLDEAFFSVLRDKDIDLVIWVAPFKFRQTNIGPLEDCRIMIIDPHVAIDTFVLNPDLVLCLESPGGNNTSFGTFEYRGKRVFTLKKC